MEKQALRRGSPAAQQGPGRPRPPLQHRPSLISPVGALRPGSPAVPRGCCGAEEREACLTPVRVTGVGPPGSQTNAGRGQRSRSPSWRPQRSTCSWLSPAARPCPACPYSLPRACPAPSCTRCQVGPGRAPSGLLEDYGWGAGTGRNSQGQGWDRREAGELGVGVA